MAIFVPRFVRQLRDVLLTAPADGEVLTYDSADEKWKNEAGGGGGGDLTDAVILAPASSARNRIVSTAEGVVPLTLETLDPGANFEWVLRLIGPDGDLGGFDSAGGLSLTFRDGDGALIIDGIAGMLGPLLQAAVQTFNNGRYSGIDKRARLYTGASEAVADGDVDGPGYIHMWFDSTDGAAKFKFKGKTLDGTVVSWEIPAGNVYVAGGTDVAVADGGTGASTAAGARTNLGLVIGADVASQADLDVEEAALAAHLADASDAHDASAVSFSPTGTIAATDVQAAIAEVASEAGGGGAPTTAPYITTAADAGLSAEVVLGTGVIMSGTLGARPAAATAGRLYFATDVSGGTLYRDTGAAWEQVNGSVSWAAYNGQASVRVPVGVAPIAAGALAFTANRVFATRFVLPFDLTVSAMRFRSVGAGTGNVDVALLSATGVRLGSAGSTAGKKGATTNQTVTLTAPVALTAGTVYYAAIESDVTDGTVMAATYAQGLEQFFGATIGLVEAFLLSSGVFPIPDPVTVGFTNTSGPIFSLVP